MTDRTREGGFRFDDELQRYWMPVLEACETLHGHYLGTHDGVSDEARDDMVAFLKYRLSHWQLSTRSGERYDESVRQVICAVLEMSTRQFFERGEVKVLAEVHKRCGNCTAFVYKGSKPWCHFSNAPTGPLDCCDSWEWERAVKKE